MLWKEFLEFVREAEMRSQIIGVLICMKTFNFFGVLLGELLLRHSDNLSRTLQATQMSAVEGCCDDAAGIEVSLIFSLFGRKPAEWLKS